MYPLESYRDLIDLSPPKPTLPLPPPTASQPEPDVVALQYLFAEHHRESEGVDIPSEHELSHVPTARRHQLIRSILTLRSPSLVPLPPNILQAIEYHLASVSRRNPDPLVPLDDIPNVQSALFPSFVPATPPDLDASTEGESTTIESPTHLDRLAFFRGDITRIDSPTLAIVNPANTQMLGCFQPNHLCADNVIHAAAGPSVRQDCFRIMETQDFTDADVGEAIITKAYSLPSGFILHTAGPKLERGAEPTALEVSQLRSTYVNCLNLAETLGTISAVGFPCISTGLFAFPGDKASLIAIKSTLEWFSAHPTSSLRVIFVLFSAKDAAHYLASLASLFPQLPPPLPLLRHFSIPDRVREWVRDSDAVIIHAGAGLSADAVNSEIQLPLDYNSRELFKKLYPDLLKTTSMETLYQSIGYDFDDPLVKWAFYLAHGNKATNWGLTPIYTKLLSFAESKSDSYTVLTSNADRIFYQSGFAHDRVYNAQGSYAHIQCLTPCTPNSFFPAQPYYDRAQPFITSNNMRLPSPDLIPTCELCGGEAFLHLRMGPAFLETPMEGMRERYEEQIADMVEKAEAKGKVVLLLELGCGFNTPGVVRVPSERLVRRFRGTVKLIRVNVAAPEVPVDIEGDAVGLKMGAVEFFDNI